MAKDSKNGGFFNTPIMRSKIKAANVKLFPEAGLGYLVGPLLALISNGIINVWLVQYWDKVLGMGEWAPLFETLLPIFSSILIVAGNLFVGKLLERKPYKRNASILTVFMKANIVSQGIFQIIILLFILFKGDTLFGVNSDRELEHYDWNDEHGYHFTIFFDVFVYDL